MSREPHRDELPFSTDDRDLTLVYFGHTERLVHVRLHTAEERYSGPIAKHASA